MKGIYYMKIIRKVNSFNDINKASNFNNISSVNNIDSKNQNNIFRIIKGALISIIITVIGLLIFAVVLTKSNISESTIPIVIIVISNLSILIGSIICNKRIEKNGIGNGMLVGLIYLLIIYLASSIAIKSFNFNLKSVIMILCSIISGTIGGIIGVNLKN